MPYLIQILKGREKKIMALLNRHGLDTRRAALSEYLITDDPSCYEIRRRDTVAGYILNISEISLKIAQELLTMPDHPFFHEERIAPNKLVQIKTGSFAGQVGIVSEMERTAVTVDVEVYGRLKTVKLAESDVELLHAPEPLL